MSGSASAAQAQRRLPSPSYPSGAPGLRRRAYTGTSLLTMKSESLATSASMDARLVLRCCSSEAVAAFSSLSSFALASAILALDSASAAAFALAMTALASLRAEAMIESASSCGARGQRAGQH